MLDQGVPRAHLRNVGGAVLGWVVMAVCVTGLMIGLFALLGPDRVFRPGGLEPTPAWLIASIAIVNEGRLATRNVRDFVAVPVELVNPWEG